MKLNFILAILVSTFCVSQSGCLLMHSNHQVVRQDEPLKPLTFESEKAKKLFEAIAQAALDDTSNQGSASFGIPFIVGLERSTKISTNAIRNDVATRTDVNGDRLISEYEASLPSNK